MTELVSGIGGGVSLLSSVSTFISAEDGECLPGDHSPTLTIKPSISTNPHRCRRINPTYADYSTHSSSTTLFQFSEGSPDSKTTNSDAEYNALPTKTPRSRSIPKRQHVSEPPTRTLNPDAGHDGADLLSASHGFRISWKNKASRAFSPFSANPIRRSCNNSRKKCNKGPMEQDTRSFRRAEVFGGNIRRKFVFVGDDAIGKTCFLKVAAGMTFPEGYGPAIHETYVLTWEVDGRHLVDTPLWHTPAYEGAERFRSLCYHNTNVFFICFGIDRPDSLENVVEKWVPEIAHHGQGRPAVLVGLKGDLRHRQSAVDALSNGNKRLVTKDEAELVKIQCGFYAYFEVSAMTGEGLLQLFEAAVRLSLTQCDTSRKRSCTVL